MDSLTGPDSRVKRKDRNTRGDFFFFPPIANTSVKVALGRNCFLKELLGVDELQKKFQRISKTYAGLCLVITLGLFIKDTQNWYYFHQRRKKTQQ